MDLTFGDLLANALAEIKKVTGKKIGVVQDEISYTFSPALSSKTIESWRYRQSPPTIEQLETLATAVIEYGCPRHDSSWLLIFLAAANHPYPQAVCDRLFPQEEPAGQPLPVRYDPPPLKAYAPPEKEGLIGRSAELSRFRQLLSKSGLAVISGMAGMGKTSVAAFLAGEQPAGRVFWHNFRDATIHSFVYRLAGFLAHHNRAELWEMYEAARLTKSSPPDLTVAFDILAAQVPRLALLFCFDDFHLVESDAVLQNFLQNLISQKHKRVRLLITTRRYPAYLPGVNQEELRGLTLADTGAFLTQRALRLPPELMAKLHDVTAGNGTFLTLSTVALRATNQPKNLIERLAKIDNIERFLMQEVNDHLSREEERVMEAVALLRGYPATRSVLEHMLEQQDVRRVLRHLGDQFLLTIDRRSEERGYSQHQIIQAFYYDQPRRDRRLALHRQAAEYFHHRSFHPFLAVEQYVLAGAAAPGVQIARENLWTIVNQGSAAALIQILETIPPADLDPLAQLDRHLLCGKLQRLAGELLLAQTHLEAAAAQLNDLPQSPETDTLKAEVCLGMGELLERQSPPEALTWVQRGLGVVPPLAEELLCTLKILAGTLHMHMGNFGGSLEMFHDGLDGLPAGPSPLHVNALKNLGAVYFNLGRLAEAADYSAQALTMSQTLRDHYQTARVYINLGPIKYVNGDWPGAIEALEKGLTIANRLGTHDTILSLHTNLGGMYVEKGDHERAFSHLNEVLRLAGDNDTQQLLTARVRLAQLANYQSEWATAELLLREAEALADQVNDQASLTTIFGYRAVARQGAGRLEEAYALIQKALLIDKTFGYDFSLGENLRILGEIAAAQDKVEEAEQAFGRSLDTLAELDPYQAALTRLSWGGRLMAAGETERGSEMLTAAQDQFEALGAVREIKAVKKIAGRR